MFHNLARRSILTGSYHLSVTIVPQQTAVVIERFGKFRKTLDPGLHFLVPLIDSRAYVHSLKEEVHQVSGQFAITKDNVTLHIDGILYSKIFDPVKASYGVDHPIEALKNLAQTTMRSELGKITLDKTFEERENLNHAIVNTINEASGDWGIKCMRYEIRDITPPPNIKKAMELQAEAERHKRSDILTSEGKRQADINIAEGSRNAAILKAEGESLAIKMKAEATAQAIQTLANALNQQGGDKAMQLRIAEQYVDAFRKLAKQTNSLIIPADAGNVSGMISQALTIFNNLQKQQGQKEIPQDIQEQLLRNAAEDRKS